MPKRQTVITLTGEELAQLVRAALGEPMADVTFLAPHGADYNSVDMPVQVTGVRVTLEA